MKTEIILFDCYAFYLEALHCFLDANGFKRNYRYHSTTDPAELHTMVTERPTVVIMNIAGFSMSEAFEHIAKLQAANPSVKLIILSLSTEVRIVKKFFEKGVKSFISRNTSASEFLHALNEVIAGRVFVTEETKNFLYSFICDAETHPEKKLGAVDDLTAREKQILDLICEGLRTKEIADKLLISVHTVESHRRNIMLKLDVRNSSMLVKFAVDNHLVN